MFDVRRTESLIEFRPRSEKDTLFAGMRTDIEIQVDRWFSLGTRSAYFLKLIENSSEVTYEETQ